MTSWTKELPSEEGSYWLYGWKFSGMQKEEPAKFYYVEVWKTGDGLSLAVDGHFLYKSDRPEGIWQKVKFPDLPKKNNDM